MKKRAAVLVDMGFLLYALYRPLGNRHPSAAEVHEFAVRCIADDEELFRIYCYHCPPFGGTQRHPLTGNPVHFSQTATYRTMTALIRELSLMDGVAFRAGEIAFNGWVIRKAVAGQIARTNRPLQEGDFQPDIKQKRVDMKIGLDVAWLASKSIVDRLILITGDSDFVPAMKFARREGVQVVFVDLGQLVKQDLRIHADEVRRIKYP